MLILIFTLEAALTLDVYCQNSQPPHEPVDVDSTDTHLVRNDTSQTSNSHFFFAIGWGNPQGDRFEFGQNIGSNIVVGATFSINDQWSNDRSGGRMGVMLGSRFAPSESYARPFVLVSAGETWGIFTKSEYYAFVHFGLNAPSNSFIHIRPEAGVDATSKNDGTGSKKRETWFGFNFSIELELR